MIVRLNCIGREEEEVNVDDNDDDDGVEWSGEDAGE